jgi:hypothetical protein
MLPVAARHAIVSCFGPGSAFLKVQSNHQPFLLFHSFSILSYYYYYYYYVNLLLLLLLLILILLLLLLLLLIIMIIIAIIINIGGDNIR